MKVFFKTLEDGKAEVDKEDVEEVLMPMNVIASLKAALEKSNSLLPQSARSFQEWNVGLLERWEGSD